MLNHEEQVAIAKRHGLCIPREPRRHPMFQKEAYCEKTGKRIRWSDGYCNGCVKWGESPQEASAPRTPTATREQRET